MNTENNYMETDLGNISPNPRGEFSEGTEYEYLDYVFYQGGSYLCLAELGTTIVGFAPEPGKTTKYWQAVALPGGLTPEYVAMHDRVVNLSEQVEADTEEVRESKESIAGMETNVETLQAQAAEYAQSAETSKDQASGYAQAAETSRQAAAESEANINAQVAGFDEHVAEKTESAETDIEAARISANKAVLAQQEESVQEIKDRTEAYIDEQKRAAEQAIEQKTADYDKSVDADIKSVNDAGDTQVRAVNAAGENKTKAVNDAGDAKVKEVNSAGAAQKKAVEDAGMEALQNIGTGIDSTLTQSGKAADAGATGAAIDELKGDISNLLDYVSDVHKAITWEEIAKGVQTRMADDMFAIGDEFTNTWTDTAASKSYDNPLRVNHFEDVELEDGTVIPGMWLQTHYAHAFGVQFSHQQAFYVADEGLPAGTYCVLFGYNWGGNGYVNSGDYWNFTLTQDVPAGGKLTGFYGAPDIAPENWKVYAYDADSKTILETVSVVIGQSGTLLGTMTAYGDDILNGIQQAAYGNNRWATSAIRQYLNSDKPKGEWWTPQSKFDIAPDQLATKDGYLCGMDPELLAVIQPVKVVTYCNTVTAEGKAQIMDVTCDKVNLISLEQMYVNPQITGEGEAHEYYKKLNGTETAYAQYGTYEEFKHYAVENHTSAQYVRLRSASRGHACNAWYVSSSGTVTNYSSASAAPRCAPIVLIG